MKEYMHRQTEVYAQTDRLVNLSGFKVDDWNHYIESARTLYLNDFQPSPWYNLMLCSFQLVLVS